MGRDFDGGGEASLSLSITIMSSRLMGFVGCATGRRGVGKSSLSEISNEWPLTSGVFFLA